VTRDLLIGFVLIACGATGAVWEAVTTNDPLHVAIGALVAVLGLWLVVDPEEDDRDGW
jgi:hypothetical protein